MLNLPETAPDDSWIRRISTKPGFGWSTELTSCQCANELPLESCSAHAPSLPFQGDKSKCESTPQKAIDTTLSLPLLADVPQMTISFAIVASCKVVVPYLQIFIPRTVQQGPAEMLPENAPVMRWRILERKSQPSLVKQIVFSHP